MPAPCLPALSLTVPAASSGVLLPHAGPGTTRGRRGWGGLGPRPDFVPPVADGVLELLPRARMLALPAPAGVRFQGRPVPPAIAFVPGEESAKYRGDLLKQCV